MNAPNRFELHVLADGEPKLTVEEDTKIPNAATITINKEDHTLAGMLRSQLLQMPHVLFAGYKVPHPLDPNFLIKIQTTSDSTPIQAVQEACTALIQLLVKIKDEMQQEFDKARALGIITAPTAAAPAAPGLDGIPDEGMPDGGLFGGPPGFDGTDTQATGFDEFI